MKKIVLILFFSLAVKGQEIPLYEPNSQIVNAEASIIIPMGRLSNKFDYAQSYGFWFKIKKENSLFVNAGFTAIILNKPRPIDYKFNDLIYSINSNKFGFDLGIRGVKIIPVSKNQKKYLELGITIGVDYLDYDFPSEETDSKDDSKNKKEYFKNITILLAPEIKYMYKNVGVKFQYRYTPYNLIDSFESDFGSNSVSFGIVYKQ